MAPTTANTTDRTHPYANRLIVGTVLAVITRWLFAQTTLNAAPVSNDKAGTASGIYTMASSAVEGHRH